MTRTSNKITSLKEAVSKHVKPNTSIYFAGMQHGEPSAAIHEIVRQKIGQLTVIPVLTHTVALLFAEGLIKKLITAYMAELYERNGCVATLARKKNAYPQLEELSHHGLAVALLAGGAGVPFMTTRSMLGTDLVKHNPNLKVIKCPFTQQPLLGIRALNPDVGIIHTQRCDPLGNAQSWGSLGLSDIGINACKKIIVTTEKVVDSDIIRRDPNRTIFPGFRVEAVVEVPWGAYPLHLAGHYNSDLGYFSKVLQTEEAYQHYVNQYIYSVKEHSMMLEKLKMEKGKDYFEKLKAQSSLICDPVVTGH